MTARLAGDEAMRCALALGVVGLVISVVGAVVMWDAGPAWYPVAVAAIAVPCGWLGGRLREAQRDTRAPALRG